MKTKRSPSKDHALHLVRDLKVPPAGFNARTASERKLLSYGLPLRPDPEKHPTKRLCGTASPHSRCGSCAPLSSHCPIILAAGYVTALFPTPAIGSLMPLNIS